MRHNAAYAVCGISGDPFPSSGDLAVTKQLAAAAKAVDIPLLDHMIIGRVGADPVGRGFYSFAASGLI